MKTQRSWFVAAALAGALLLAQPAPAARISAQIMVSGTLSSVSAQSVTIGGQQYTVQPGSPAAQTVTSLTAGQTVEAVLSGPAADPTSQVIAIYVQ